ncbi:hypothetical protein D3C86_1254040 [compost metagenome]
MRRPGEAVDAAVLTAPVRIDRDIERDVWRGVARQDRAGLLQRDLGDEPGRQRAIGGSHVVGRRPAVVERLALVALEASLEIADGAAPLAGHGRAAGTFALPVAAEIVIVTHLASDGLTRVLPPRWPVSP